MRVAMQRTTCDPPSDERGHCYGVSFWSSACGISASRLTDADPGTARVAAYVGGGQI
jgi:hypothetical protein